jgi:LisH domain-containing protein ARMC9
MINDNVIEWLVGILEQNEDLSDYSLEYAAALFMNLSLRTAGKKRLANENIDKKTLSVISDLLGNANTEVFH